MTTQNIKLNNLININTQEAVCPQYNNRKVNSSKSIIKVGEPLRIVDIDGIFFSHEVIVDIFEDGFGFQVETTNKIWFFEYCDEHWNGVGGNVGEI